MITGDVQNFLGGQPAILPVVSEPQRIAAIQRTDAILGAEPFEITIAIRLNPNGVDRIIDQAGVGRGQTLQPIHAVQHGDTVQGSDPFVFMAINRKGGYHVFEAGDIQGNQRTR
ncbi:MAG: hypothetical protein ALAOOOJD_00086 [bacterium]|nr:hypothetical protein [bacterium]